MNSHRRRLFVVIAFSSIVPLGGVVSWAQEVPAPRITFEHDGEGTTGFALYAQPQKGKTIRVDLGLVLADGHGARSVPVPALPEGSYTLSIAAYNLAGESPRVPASPAMIAIRRKDSKWVDPATVVDTVVLPHGPTQETEKTSPPPTTKAPKGPLGRLWRLVVGED